MALLGLLDREPSHGYDLKRDYDTYFGRGRPLPFGQVYATLARLGEGRKGGRRRSGVGSWPGSQALHDHRDRQVRGRDVARRADPARAVSADRTVREGRPLAHARSSRGGVPRHPTRPRTSLGCASSPSSSRRATSSMRSSPIMASSIWRPICAGSTSPRRGSPRSPRRWRREPRERSLLSPDRRSGSRSARSRAFLRGDASASWCQLLGGARRDPRGDGAERLGQVDLAPLSGRHPRPGLR